jgi:hypothetical protein
MIPLPKTTKPRAELTSLLGQRLEVVVQEPWPEACVLVFETGYAILAAERGYNEASLVEREPGSDDIGPLVKAGLLTEAQVAEHYEAEQAEHNRRRAEREREQYEALKKKFEGQ